VSRANIERLFKSNPETAAEDDPMLKRMINDPEFPKEWGATMMSISHGIDPSEALTDLDFTQYYPEKLSA
jgi:hypothetical protein